MDRRGFFGSLGSGFIGALLFGSREAGAWPRGARAHRRRVRRRIRRRFRRRVAIRMWRGHPLWVVPVGLAVGWELVHENRVVVVKETKFIEVDGAKTEVAIVQGSDGKTEQVMVAREDTPENGKNLEGSVIPDDDKKTPGVESEAEAEE
jgi:hypothetical protein